jgi:arginyl-tRNA synthetase
MLTRKNDAPFDFDLKKVIEQSKDTTIFYVQYAHTRCCSVLRNLLQELPEFYHKILDDKQKLKPIDNYDFLYNLKDEQEIILIKKITNFPRIIEMSAINFEPHRMAFYLQDLSAEFHSLWNKGIENPELKFIIKNNFSTTMARIYLIISLKTVISECLDIFNIKALEQMT